MKTIYYSLFRFHELWFHVMNMCPPTEPAKVSMRNFHDINQKCFIQLFQKMFFKSIHLETNTNHTKNTAVSKWVHVLHNKFRTNLFCQLFTQRFFLYQLNTIHICVLVFSKIVQWVKINKKDTWNIIFTIQSTCK